jgi:hypothetical protein
MKERKEKELHHSRHLCNLCLDDIEVHLQVTELHAELQATYHVWSNESLSSNLLSLYNTTQSSNKGLKEKTFNLYFNVWNLFSNFWSNSLWQETVHDRGSWSPAYNFEVLTSLFTFGFIFFTFYNIRSHPKHNNLAVSLYVRKACL